MSTLITYMLVIMSTLMLVALGGMFAERSGVINIGLEGVMILGMVGSTMVLMLLPATIPAFVAMLIALAVGAAFGIVCSMLIAVAAIHFKADQTLVGTAVNMLALAFATVFSKAFTGGMSGDIGQTTMQFTNFFGRSFYAFTIGDAGVSWYFIIAIIILIASAIILYKTRFGLRLRSCGEHPQAAASLGVNVYKMRYMGVGISGILGGLGGVIYATATTSTWDTVNGASGLGFLAMAVMIFGQWKPVKIFWASLLFSFFSALPNAVSAMPAIEAWGLNGEFYKLLPYLVCLIVLAFTSGKSRAPKAEGIPYDPGMR